MKEHKYVNTRPEAKPKGTQTCLFQTALNQLNNLRSEFWTANSGGERLFKQTLFAVSLLGTRAQLVYPSLTPTFFLSGWVRIIFSLIIFLLFFRPRSETLSRDSWQLGRWFSPWSVSVLKTSVGTFISYFLLVGKKRLIFIVISRLIYKYYMYVIVFSYKLSALLWRSHPKNKLCQKFVHPKDPVVRHEE